ncbi:GntR family transcriptional regulator [Thalassococcus sp. BH17M4-6]|uniref:GntR family transcriptional regulator n=1 Tax=Thalassococcus sp. BH17M4-6 TaxID=3413148 RepID=UPI003BC19F21
MAEQNLPEQVAQQLRRDILRGVLKPGASIKERDSAAELGVSRTPMREAIRILAKEGLVQLRPARSPIVVQMSLSEVADSIEVLSALELLSGKLACLNASDEDIAAVRQAERYVAENFDRLDDIDRFEADMEFHLSIARASRNAALIGTHSSYLARLWRARFLSAARKRSRDRVLSQHEAIVRSIEARDIEGTQKALGEHLEHLLINVEEFYESEDKTRDQGRGDAASA